MARGDLTGEEWSLIEPHLPLGERGPIPDLRQRFNAVMRRFRTGSPWRDLSAEYGPWSTEALMRIQAEGIRSRRRRGQGDGRHGQPQQRHPR
ncbi:transposase [Streptosporangium sp. NPDC006013]|uniref:transposase n=1 Tax=Streptosporangium sp. NPDC006013 TaxID=3155596 RepID=UPI0033B1D1CA